MWLQLATKSQLSEYVTQSDIDVFERRAQAEGMSFLTTTLPRLSKGLLQAFSLGALTGVEFSGWQLQKDCAYPRFLSRAYATLFAPNGTYIGVGGRPISDYFLAKEKGWGLQPLHCAAKYEAGAVACIRQLSEVFYKLELEPTKEQVQQTIDAFKGVERDIELFSTTLVRTGTPIDTSSMADRLLSLQKDIEGASSAYSIRTITDRAEGVLDAEVRDYTQIMHRARRLVHRLLEGTDPLQIRPSHGSGASACKVKPHKRYETFRFIPRLHEVYPWESYYCYNPTAVVDHLEDHLAERPGDYEEPSARVVFVPKDSRGPRLISAEPREFMFVQQGLNRLLEEQVERYPAIARMVSWKDQTRNRVMAQMASYDPSLYATLDLKEASDRLTWNVVKYLFPPAWVHCLGACRSLQTQLPGGELVHLRKFAPMGSACCFPVESICFWAIAASAANAESENWFRTSRKKRGSNHWNPDPKRISVYGDDIIVPLETVSRVERGLQLAGLIVNRTKSFSGRIPFRESCGMDAYAGFDVTPVRLKHLPTDDRRGQHRTMLWANNLVARYGSGVDVMGIYPLLESWYGPQCRTDQYDVVAGKAVLRTSGIAFISPNTFIPPSFKTRFNRRYQRREVFMLRARSREFTIPLTSWGQVLRAELERFSEQSADRGTIAHRISYKMSWCAM
jgi:hypothetical protein